jgi:hypothetical protein
MSDFDQQTMMILIVLAVPVFALVFTVVGMVVYSVWLLFKEDRDV